MSGARAEDPTPHACRRYFLSILYLDGTTPNHFIVHGDGVARRLHFLQYPRHR